MIADLHVHTDFCDGRDSAEDMVLSAISKGVGKLGLVVHSYVPFDPESCVQLDRVEDYLYEISILKEKYKDKIELLCGIEADYYSPQDTSPFDYVIGSVHYLYIDGKYKAIDDQPYMLGEMIEQDFGGSFYACAEEYFATVAKLAEKKPDFIGHFDLIKKFSRAFPFDPENQRYRDAWMIAADALLQLKVPFEINTGGINRGWTDEPYPSAEILEYITKNGGKTVYASDAHRKEDIARGFGG